MVTWYMESLHYGSSPFWHFWTVHFDTFRPSTLTLSGRSFWYFWTVHFDAFRPYNSTLSDCSLWYFWTDTLIHPKDRLLWPMIVHLGSKGRPVWLNTVHFKTFTLLDCPLRSRLFIIRENRKKACHMHFEATCSTRSEFMYDWVHRNIQRTQIILIQCFLCTKKPIISL